MSRISRIAVTQAVAKVQGMNMAQKEWLAEELAQCQLNLLAAVVVQPRLGVPLHKVDFLFDVLFVCYQSMKESGLSWSLITEDDMDRQLQRFSASVKFGAEMGQSLRDQSVQRYIDDYPEKGLLSYVMTRCTQRLKQVEPGDTDKYVIIAAANIVNCIAFVAVQAKGSDAHPNQTENKK